MIIITCLVLHQRHDRANLKKVITFVVNFVGHMRVEIEQVVLIHFKPKEIVQILQLNLSLWNKNKAHQLKIKVDNLGGLILLIELINQLIMVPFHHRECQENKEVFIQAKTKRHSRPPSIFHNGLLQIRPSRTNLHLVILMALLRSEKNVKEISLKS